MIKMVFFRAKNTFQNPASYLKVCLFDKFVRWFLVYITRLVYSLLPWYLHSLPYQSMLYIIFIMPPYQHPITALSTYNTYQTSPLPTIQEKLLPHKPLHLPRFLRPFKSPEQKYISRPNINSQKPNRFKPQISRRDARPHKFILRDWYLGRRNIQPIKHPR